MAKTKKPVRNRPLEPTIPATAVVAEPVVRAKKQTQTEQFQQEYAYVLKDLRLVFILAGAMFALLIILNLVLR